MAKKDSAKKDSAKKAAAPATITLKHLAADIAESQDLSKKHAELSGGIGLRAVRVAVAVGFIALVRASPPTPRAGDIPIAVGVATKARGVSMIVLRCSPRTRALPEGARALFH